MTFIPHGICLARDPWLIGIHAISDMFIGLAYIVIAFILFKVKRRLLESDYVGRAVLGWSAAFIILCAATHFFDLTIIWHPVYQMQGIVKAVTAIVSIITAGLFVKLKLALMRSDN